MGQRARSCPLEPETRMSSVSANQNADINRAQGRLGPIEPAHAAMFTLLGGAFVLVFFRWMLKQHHFSSKYVEDWGHAWFVPLIAGFLIWQSRHALMQKAREVFWPGLLPVVVGMACYFFFIIVVPNHMLQGASMILTVFGLVLMLFGPGMMTVLFPAVAYLGFAVTISQQIMTKATFGLKLIASSGAGLTLEVLGSVFNFDVERNGNIITVGGMPMDVADACSGMRTVVAFLALGAAVALIACPHWWQRVWLMMLAIPIAIGLNIVRVVVLGMLMLWDPELSTGEAHTMIGTLLLVPGLGAFLLVVWALNRAVVDESGGAA
jgi:exosortase